MGHPGAQHPRTVHYLALARPSFQVLDGLFIKKLPPYGRSISLVGHPGAQHPRTNEQSTGLFITSLSLGRPFKSCMAFL